MVSTSVGSFYIKASDLETMSKGSIKLQTNVPMWSRVSLRFGSTVVVMTLVPNLIGPRITLQQV